MWGTVELRLPDQAPVPGEAKRRCGLLAKLHDETKIIEKTLRSGVSILAIAGICRKLVAPLLREMQMTGL